MSYPPPHGYPYGKPGWQAPPSNPYPAYTPSNFHQATLQQPPMPFFIPGTMMGSVPVTPQMPQTYPQVQQPGTSQPTYVTNVYYQGDPPVSEPVQISEYFAEYEWVPSTSTTAKSNLTGKAVVGGKEVLSSRQLWIIRSWHNGDLIPGKLSLRLYTALVPYGGREIPVHNFEVLCAKPENVKWVPAANGQVPPGAIEGGRTASGETLYVGRAKHNLSLIPGKVHPTHSTCYIGVAGTEVAVKNYDVLCRVS